MKFSGPRKSVTVSTVEPNRCLICKSTTVVYRISYMDMDDPQPKKSPVTGSIMPTESGFSCQEHMLEAVKQVTGYETENVT